MKATTTVLTGGHAADHRVDRACPPAPEPPSPPTGCPACQPLGATVTSRYCARHLRQLRAGWLAGRSAA